MHEFIREVVLKAFGKEIAENVSILTVVLNLKMQRDF
jgi:DNA-binding protein